MWLNDRSGSRMVNAIRGTSKTTASAVSAIKYATKSFPVIGTNGKCKENHVHCLGRACVDCAIFLSASLLPKYCRCFSATHFGGSTFFNMSDKKSCRGSGHEDQPATS